MMWAIVSLPFWLVGLLLFVVTSAGLWVKLKERRDLGLYLTVAFGLWILSGAILIVAAKVAGAS